MSLFREAVDCSEEQSLRERETAEEMEEERELYMSELPEREADYHARLTQWKASREMRVREGGRREGGRELTIQN